MALGVAHSVTAQWSLGLLFIVASVAARSIAMVATTWITAALSRRTRDDEERAIRDTSHSLSTLQRQDALIDSVSVTPMLRATEGAGLASITSLVLVVVVAGWLSALIVIALSALSVPAYIAFGRSSARALEQFQLRRSALVRRQLEVIDALTDLKGVGAVEYGIGEIEAASRAEGRVVINGVRATVKSTLVTEFLGGVSIGLVAMVVGLGLWHGSITLTRALAAVFFTAEYVAWLRRAGSEFHQRSDAIVARAALDSLKGTHDRASRSGEPHDAALLHTRDLATHAPAQPISLCVRPGDRVRIDGPSGIGKSSFLDAALGLRAASSGTVTCSAQRTGLIRPTAHFLDGTWRDNLDPLGQNSEVEIQSCLSELGLNDSGLFALDSPSRDNGGAISSGERVRLAIVRALLSDVQLLVLDDVAGVLDVTGRDLVGQSILRRPHIATIEATNGGEPVVDTQTVIPVGHQ